MAHHYGFNFQWMFIWRPGAQPEEPDLKALDFIAGHGFNFVRVTTDYRFWINLQGADGPDYFHPNEDTFYYIDRYLQACRERGIHLSLNQHRAPGYCINANHLERHNLWVDEVAQKAFIFLWQTFARRYQEVPASALSFDLLNEPPNPGQYEMTRESHAALMRQTVQAIHEIDPGRPITVDGLGGGSIAMPELADLDVTHSGRGYQPMALTHYKANWWDGYQGLPEPVYPGLNWMWNIWNKDALREFYQPWRDVEAQGARIHIGEFGCFNQTPNDVALRWFTDLFALYKEFGWGFSLWEFNGPFGIIEHGRPGTKYEQYHGYQVDRALLDLMIESRG
jgi:aryl-phospho-beta-D-glucosidase BglC (GH1 family)